MPTFGSLAAVGRFYEDRAAEMVRRGERMPIELAEKSAPVLWAATKEVAGKAPPLVDLAQTTQDERVALGYSANDPLVRSGSLRDSYKFESAGPIAAAGTYDMRGFWHEHGYMNARTGRQVPPRPILFYGLLATEAFVKAFMRLAIKAMMEV